MLRPLLKLDLRLAIPHEKCELISSLLRYKVTLPLNSEFAVPESYPLNAAGCRIDENGQKYIRVKGVRWFTNMEYPQRHEELVLYKKYTPEEYPKYDNYDAINIDKTSDIPYDYDGAIGVPITFLDKYNPEQFEIIKFRKGNDDKDLSINGICPYFRILIRKKGVSSNGN